MQYAWRDDTKVTTPTRRAARLPRAARTPIRPAMADRTSNRPDLPAEIARRRTFAIISHPD
ncbi:MAG: hypothetical protein AAF761_11995, partial [Pseudomonadota bacterium]